MALTDNRIATVDAVSGSTIRCTLSLNARGTPVRGKFVTIVAGDDLLLGRICAVSLTNQVHDDATFAAYIMTHGGVPYWSGDVDIETADIDIIRVVEGTTHSFVPMRRNPPSGSPIEAAAPSSFAAFANESRHVVTVGTIPNSDGLAATIINRSHGDYEKGGWGEARHCCIFGQNGSGKTVMATTLLCAKLAAHPEMGMLMPDTAGDLSSPHKHNRGDFRWNYVDVLRRADVRLDIIDIGNIRLSSPGLLKLLLQDVFCKRLSMASEKAATLAERVVDALYQGDVDLKTLTSDTILAEVCASIGPIYARSSRQEHVDDADDLAHTPARRRVFDRDVEDIRHFFDGREPLDALIRDVLSRGRKVIIRMHGLDDKEKDHVMREVMVKLANQARRLFMGDHGAANAMVVLDEANRWAPQGDDGGTVAEIVKRNARETRKYGLGWWFIAQSPATIDKTVLRESHTKWFGRGLGVGVDRQHLLDVLGKEGVEEYERLMMQGGFFWVGIGQDNNVGTEGTYFSVHPFGGDATEAFIDANPRLYH